MNKTSLTIITALLAVAFQPLTVWASTNQTIRTIQVGNVDDYNPDGGCTLREAIDLANEGAIHGLASNDCSVREHGTGEITYRLFVPEMVYTLIGDRDDLLNLSGDLNIFATNSVEIIGSGKGRTIIQGGHTTAEGVDRVFNLSKGTNGESGNVKFSGVTIRHGNAFESSGRGDGGGIKANGQSGTRLTIVRSAISANEASWGAGLSYGTSQGTAIIRKSRFTENTATEYGGGGIRFSGTEGISYITASKICRNVSFKQGGGIEHFSTDGRLTIRNSLICENEAATNGGGGISHAGSEEGSLTILKSRITGNVAVSGNGGGIDDQSCGGNSPCPDNTITLLGVTIKDNIAELGVGGGIAQVGATVNIEYGEVKDNMDVGGAAPDCSGTLNAGADVVIGDSTGCTIE